MHDLQIFSSTETWCVVFELNLTYFYMITFPKYYPLATVVKAVKANVKANSPKGTLLPVLSYIGCPEPAGVKVVLEIDNTGIVMNASPKAAFNWANANASALDKIVGNLQSQHQPMPDDMTLNVVGYVDGDKLTVLDAQLIVRGQSSPYWFAIAVLTNMLDQVDNVESAFNVDSVFSQIDFNNTKLFSPGTMLWQCANRSSISEVLVVRDPYRITA